MLSNKGKVIERLLQGAFICLQRFHGCAQLQANVLHFIEHGFNPCA